MQVGSQIKVTTKQESNDAGWVTWVVRAEVTAVTTTEIEWKTIDLISATAHPEDAPVSGVIAKIALPLLKKAGRVEIL